MRETEGEGGENEGRRKWEGKTEVEIRDRKSWRKWSTYYYCGGLSHIHSAVLVRYSLSNLAAGD